MSATVKSYPLLSQSTAEGYLHQRFPVTQSHHASPVDTSEIEHVLKYRHHVLDGKGELAGFVIEHIARRALPYGIWHCAGGRTVLFNREYQAIFERSADGTVGYADRDEAVMNIQHAEMLWDEVHSPIRYLTRHLGREGHSGLSRADVKACRKALLVCLRLMRQFTPAEHASVSDRYSLVDYSMWRM